MTKKSSFPNILDFINSSPSPFHAVNESKNILLAHGYSELFEHNKWSLASGGKHFVVRNNTSIIAFMCGQRPPRETGFRLAVAHVDSPALKIKPNSEFTKDGIWGLRIEPYGGTILSTWLDRELDIAGQIIVEKNKKKHRVFFKSKSSIGIIPNLAIHLNREVNKGFEYNPHLHLGVFLGSAAKPATSSALKSYLATEINCSPAHIIDADLFLLDATEGRYSGIKGEFISAPRLDNLTSCHAILDALATQKPQAHTSVGVLFDNEEVGSLSAQGADSFFARDVLERIELGFKGDTQDIKIAFARSFIVSADVAHAVHPHFSDKHDDNYAPRLNMGPVIKKHAQQRYATNSNSAAIFSSLCAEVDVPCQWIINRADVACGSTVGPVLSSLLGMPTVDVGCPLLAMHSIRETGGALDQAMFNKVIKHYFSGAKI